MTRHGENSGSIASGESTSSSLLRRVKANDADAWRRFVDLYGALVYYWCRRAGLMPEDAADVVQEVFGALASAISGFRKERPGDTFRGWLWTIARNKIRDHFRARGNGPEAAGGSDAQQQLLQVPEPNADISVAESLLPQRALELIESEFEKRTWQAFWRATVEGQSAAEIAGDLGMTKNAVRQAKFRVLRKLRDDLADN